MSKILGAHAHTVEPYTEDELHAVAREIAGKVSLKVVDTFSSIGQQGDSINALQTYWGPMFYFAVATPRRGATFAGTHAFGEAVQMTPKPRLFSLVCMVPPGALPGHFQQVDTILTRVALMLGAPKQGLTRATQAADATGKGTVVKLYTGAATRAVHMVTLSWDLGDDGEERDEG